MSSTNIYSATTLPEYYTGNFSTSINSGATTPEYYTGNFSTSINSGATTAVGEGWYERGVNYYLINDNGNIKVIDVTNHSLTTLGTTPTKNMFINNGMEQIKITETVSESYDMTDEGSLGAGKKFSQAIDLTKFEIIDNIGVV